jgi:diacylglycerol O-acyltransferase
VHVVVSNVPGPREPLILEGARLVQVASIGPLIEGAGDQLYGVELCRRAVRVGARGAEAVPDLPVLAAALRSALAELQAAGAALWIAPRARGA